MDLSLMIQSFAPTLAMTWNPVVTNVLVGVFLVVSIAMILLVLIQRPQGGGLSGAFGAGGGGGGAGQTAFGTKTGDVLTGATITIFVLFLVTAIVLNFATRPPKPTDSVPVLSAPAGASEESATEAIEDAQSNDAADLIDDAMESEPVLESETPAEDTPVVDEPASDEPASTEDQPN